MGPRCNLADRFACGVALHLEPGAGEAGPATSVIQPLRLTGVTIAVNPSSGGCGTKYVFSGRIVLGARSGQVTYEWIKPYGSTTDPATTTIDVRNGTVDTQLDYEIDGAGMLSEDVVLHVLKPVDLRSAPAHIAYGCG
jgi:hypothetical protein